MMASYTASDDWLQSFIEITGASEAEALNFFSQVGAIGPGGELSMEEVVNLYMDSRDDSPTPEQQRMRRNAVSTAIDPLRNFEVETNLQEQTVETIPGPHPTNPNPAVAFDPDTGVSRFENLFRTPLDLLFTGDLAQAREHATSRSRWLLIEVQNRTIFNSLITSRDLWPNAAVHTLVQENFIFTQFEAENPLAQYVSRVYQVDLELLPYLALLDPRTGENLHHWGGTGDPVDVLRFAAYLRAFIEVNGQVNRFNPPIEVPESLVQNHYEIEPDLQLAIQASVAQQPTPGYEDSE